MSVEAFQDAEIVVIGGGAVGCGVAYSLARAGKTDVLLIERADDVGQVTTSQGAGLCGQVRSTVERTRLAMHSVATFRELQQDPDVRPEWNEVGSLRIALSDRRAQEFQELQAISARAGLEVRRIDREEARRLWPGMDFREVKAVLWCPSDGTMTPYAVVRSYARQCRNMGARFATSTRVERIECRNGAVEAVHTDRGRVACRYVINAAGAHAYHVARLVGLELPIVPVRHEYFVTVPIEGLHPDSPCFRIPEMTLYGRATGESLLLGGWECRALRTDPRSYELQESPPPVTPDRAVLDDFEAQFARLFPQVRGVEKTRVGKGWPTFTPDGQFIIGESCRVRGFVMAGGCNAHGISGSAGIGRLLVEALLDPHPGAYVQSLSPDRFTERSWNWEEAARQAQHVYETYYGT
ncbi:MAG TPA: FAD-dependent oxidoreductase [Chthonomonadaceae bacterium]|nr:FAD-dependent oxidoreductase [Chthonomonadaceae bacterium]